MISVLEKPLTKSSTTLSINNIFNYIKQRHPEVVKEAQESFKPLEYPLSMIGRIRDYVYEMYGPGLTNLGMFTSRDVVLGVIVLIYSRYKIGELKTHYMHEGAGVATAYYLDMKESNLSNKFDEVCMWLKADGYYKVYAQVCEKIKQEITASF
ncbi:hypothetical protein ABDK00_013250 [Niabella insulamsoli]|uniref:hypothetical protein n=1 Tax=Niabella insulamsoli TaxID=3144874 RepID=UPI0031FDCE7D